MVLLLPHDGFVERVVDDRVLPVPVAEVAVGMDIVLFPAQDRRSLFRRLAPHLDDLRGLGTRLWLRIWRETFSEALKACDSRPIDLAAEICRRGGDIKAQAVAEWGSPYRIGPAKDLHVHLVAIIAHDAVATANAARISKVMAGVRQLHRDVGRAVARTARQHLAGRRDALDALERSLGQQPAEIVAAELESMSAWKITEVLGTGTARAGALGRPLRPRQATHLFVREDS